MALDSARPECVQVFPPSADLYTPSPWMMLPRSWTSPIPTYTTSGFDSATATAPTDDVFRNLSAAGLHVVPPSVVFHRPPPVAPK